MKTKTPWLILNDGPALMVGGNHWSIRTLPKHYDYYTHEVSAQGTPNETIEELSRQYGICSGDCSVEPAYTGILRTVRFRVTDAYGQKSYTLPKKEFKPLEPSRCFAVL